MMPLVQSNVVIFNNNSVFQDISAFLAKHKDDPKDEKYTGTALDYERDIIRFFAAMRGKELSQLTVKDLYFFPKDVVLFQNFLLSTGLKSATVNRNIASVKSLFKYLETSRYKFKDEETDEWVYIKANQLSVDPIENNDADSYGIFSDSEVKQILELVKEEKNGIRKSLAIEFASVTSFRIQAVVTLKRNSFRQESGVWVAKALDKGVWHEKSIRNDLYERLMENIPEGEDDLFDFSSKTAERSLNLAVKKMGLDPERNLTFHSLKKYGINEVFTITNGNIIETATQGNHSSFETAYKYYLEFSKDFAKMPCLLIGQEVDSSPIDELSHEELLALVKNSSRGLQYELLHNLKKQKS